MVHINDITLNNNNDNNNNDNNEIHIRDDYTKIIISKA